MGINTKNLRRLRRKQHLSLSDVANSIGKNRVTIWRYEQGKSRIPADILFLLGDLYGVSTDLFRCQETAKLQDGGSQS